MPKDARSHWRGHLELSYNLVDFLVGDAPALGAIEHGAGVATVPPHPFGKFRHVKPGMGPNRLYP